MNIFLETIVRNRYRWLTLLLVVGSLFNGRTDIHAQLLQRRLQEAQDREANSPAELARKEGERYYQQGDYQRVIAITNQLIAKDANDHVALHLRASAKIELGRTSGSVAQVREGIADSRRALSLAGTKFAWLHVPYFYGLTSLAELEKRPEHADMAISIANPLLERGTVASQDRSYLLYQRALAHSVKQNWKAAATDFNDAIRLTPDLFGAYVKRSQAYAALGDAKQTLASYDETVRVFPNNAQAYNDRGNYRRTAGDLDGAITDLTRAVQIDPRMFVSYISRGVCLGEQNNPQAAEADFNAALQLPLGNYQPTVYRLRAAARLSQGQAAGAIEDYSAAIRLAPQMAVFYEERGYARYAKKDFTAAAEDFQKTRQLDPQAIRVVPWESLALSRAKQTDPARAVLEDGLRDKPTAETWPGQLCRYLAGQSTEQELLQAANDSNPTFQTGKKCEAHFFIGSKKTSDGTADAAEHFRQSVATKSFTLAAYRASRFELGELK